MRFKSNKVWLALDPDGEPLLEKGKVLIKYQRNQDYEYWVYPTALRPVDEPNDPLPESPAHTPAPPENQRKNQPGSDLQQDPDGRDAVVIYTDGASSGNPGPSGIGVVLRFGDHQKEISRHIGISTNNIAELEAIKTGLSEMKRSDMPVRLYTDSSYAHGVLVLGWKAKKNTELIESIRRLMLQFSDLKIILVRGHRGVAGNERADQLATAAVNQAQPH